MKADLTLRLCMPNGFCAGVERAIHIVVLALKKYGAPVYVRHEIVHNKYVVEALKKKGAVFIDDLHELTVQQKDRPVIFSAHGVAQLVHKEAIDRGLFYLDATCPLVSKVHKQAMRHQRLGRHILLIGHRGHPEVVGTMGQVSDEAISLIETLEDAKTFVPPKVQPLGYITQTTLSIEDTELIIEILKERFPDIAEPAAQSICYATTNRQEAVKKAAHDCDFFIIIGSPTSSNSKRLVEVAGRNGAKKTFLMESIEDLKWEELTDLRIVAISAGASAPQILVNQLIENFESRYNLNFELVETIKERQKFLLSNELRDMELTAQDMEFLNGVS